MHLSVHISVPSQSTERLHAGGGGRTGLGYFSDETLTQYVEQAVHEAKGEPIDNLSRPGDLTDRRQREQLERAHLLMLGAMLVQVGQRASRLGPVQLHPPTADLDEVGALLGGAAQDLVGHRRVVDDDLPLHQRRRTEPATRVAVLRLRGDARRRAAKA